MIGRYSPVLVAMMASVVAWTSDTPEVEQIVRQANHAVYYQGADGRAQATLTIVDGRGRKRTKAFSILRRDDGAEDADQRFYLYFRKPADERGISYLIWKHIERDDDRWLYLPGLDVQKRIAASDKRTSFAGSHFFYEDLSGRHVREDRHALIEVSETYYVVRSQPKQPDDVEFDSYTMWIHRGTFLPVEIRYSREDEVYRVAKILAVETIQGHPTITRASIEDLRTGGSTTLDYRSIEYDLGLEPTLFTERYLRHPPLEQLD